MEQLNCEYPVGFWEAIKKLGRKPKKKIPQEVYMPGSSVSVEFGDVMRIWEEEFISLLNPAIMVDNAKFCLNRVVMLWSIPRI